MILKSLRDDAGATALEFAILTPIFIILLFALVEFSTISFAKSVLEGATTITSRLGKTGYTNETQSREDMLRQLLTEKSHGILDPAKIRITTLIYQGFSTIGAAEPLTDQNGNGQWDAGETFADINGNGEWDSDMGEAGLGGAGDIVVYTVTYPWDVKTPMLEDIMENENGEFLISSSAVVRNEPY